MENKVSKMVMASLFAALTCIATMVIKVPTIGTNGYVNIGDSIVLLSTWIMGNPFGALAAGIGSGLADLLSGYAMYVPGTTIIKFLMAFISFFVYALLKKLNVAKILCYSISGLVAELIMVAGYFLYEALFLGYGLAAVSAVPYNCIQGITCLITGILLILALDRAKYFNIIKSTNK